MNSPWRRESVCWLVIGMAGAFIIAQDRGRADPSTDASEFIKSARDILKNFRIEDVETGTEIERVENPVFRYLEPIRGPVQGALWIWGGKGRPVAVLEMIRYPAEDLCCFHATSDRPIKLVGPSGPLWTPQSSDLRFKKLADAPRPADSPTRRLRQMKDFVQKFTAHEIWDDQRSEMRILPAPVHRYDDEAQGLLDGAVFVIAIGTHPEATLFLEAVHGGEGEAPVWKFAVGRSGAAEMVVNYEDKEAQHLPRIEDFPPPTNSYWRMVLRFEKK